MRVRGLKHREVAVNEVLNFVAPHAGAWIETIFADSKDLGLSVAPHAGAWIETPSFIYIAH